MPGRLHDGFVFAVPTWCGYLVVLGESLGCFFISFFVVMHKTVHTEKEALVLSGEPSLSTDNSCSAKDSLKMLMKEVFVWKINLACLTRFIS